ncbi:MAG: hypothetical protein V9E94_15650 [Microthrixaceae bacterium]
MTIPFATRSRRHTLDVERDVGLVERLADLGEGFSDGVGHLQPVGALGHDDPDLGPRPHPIARHRLLTDHDPLGRLEAELLGHVGFEPRFVEIGYRSWPRGVDDIGDGHDRSTSQQRVDRIERVRESEQRDRAERQGQDDRDRDRSTDPA